MCLNIIFSWLLIKKKNKKENKKIQTKNKFVFINFSFMNEFMNINFLILS